MFKLLHSLSALWSIAKWLDAQKKAMEANTDAYLTDDRAKEWRLFCEKLFYALEHGNGNLTMLPKPVRWFFSRTTLDNRIGRFGQVLLKSSKLAADDPTLREFANYPAH